MLEILTRAGCFILIIILGNFMRRVGVFKAEDFTVLSKLVIRVTLPAAIITSFAGKEIDPSMLALVLVGLGSGILYIALGFLLNVRGTRERRVFEIINLPGYNIGNFTLPFAQSFLGSTGVIVTSLFDTGNAMIALGGAYGMASLAKDGGKFSLKPIGKALLRSVPFLTYIIMVTTSLAHIPIPGLVVSCAQTIANGNAFLAMFMIGVGFNLSGDRSQIGTILRVLAVRYAVSVVLGLLCYFCLPFALEIRQTLVILVFSPVSTVVPAFTGELGGDVGLSSAINSLSIVISIVSIVTLLTVML